ncbi:MAG TPA: hypothetical protein VGX94_02205 [Terriglobia bacterium]|nr:hypothetical protein [Terriglobia bacterium]
MREKTIGLIFMIAFSAAAYGASTLIPRSTDKTLTGASVSIPEAGSKEPLLLVLSFSHKASGDVKKWNNTFQSTYQKEGVQYYELEDFQGVPSFVMRMILHGMRRSIQEPERSHVVPFFKQENAWKKLVNYQRSDIAYVILADTSGSVISQVRGPFDEPKAANIKRAIAGMRAQIPTGE